MKQETFSHATYWREAERTLSLQVIDDPRLSQDALCAQTDPEAFFPEKGGSTRDAKRVCGACAVRGACLDYALAHDEEHGVWGGLSKRERDAEKNRRARNAQDTGEVADINL